MLVGGRIGKGRHLRFQSRCLGFLCSVQTRDTHTVKRMHIKICAQRNQWGATHRPFRAQRQLVQFAAKAPSFVDGW